MCIECGKIKANMRDKWIMLHLNSGVSLSQIAKISGYHRNTLSLWKQRYLEHGLSGLMDQSKKPHSCNNEYSDELKQKIILLRTNKSNRRAIGPLTIKNRLEKRYGIKASRSGIAKLLKREGLVDPGKTRRLKKKQRIKQCKIKDPGELVQMNVKYALKSHSEDWCYQYSAIDYLTGIAYGSIYELQSNMEVVLFARSLTGYYPFGVTGIQADNHSTFTNRYTGYLKSADPFNPRIHPLDLECQRLNVKHYLIDKGKPAQNGKVERFHRTCEEEFYQREKFRDLNSARKKFRDFLYYYNHEREHQGLNNLTPVEKLQTISEYANIKELIIK